MVGLVASGPEVETFLLGKMAFEGPDMRRDTIFRIASMTKPVTATPVMMLVEEGQLKLDEPVDRLLPELANRGVLRRIDAALDDTVPARRPITVEDLLTFRCGVRADSGAARTLSDSEGDRRSRHLRPAGPGAAVGR